MTAAIAALLVGICHMGAPCDPPIVDGYEFAPIEDGLYFAEVPEEVAQGMLRVTGFKQFGGKRPDAAEKAETERLEAEKDEAEKASADKAAAKKAAAAKEKEGK